MHKSTQCSAISCLHSCHEMSWCLGVVILLLIVITAFIGNSLLNRVLQCSGVILWAVVEGENLLCR